MTYTVTAQDYGTPDTRMSPMKGSDVSHHGMVPLLEKFPVHKTPGSLTGW